MGVRTTDPSRYSLGYEPARFGLVTRWERCNLCMSVPLPSGRIQPLNYKSGWLRCKSTRGQVTVYSKINVVQRR